MRSELHSGVKPMTSIIPVAIGTTGTGQAGKIVDRRGFRRVEIYINYGAVTSSTAVFTPVFKHGDVTGTMTSVADADLDGTEVLAGLAAGARVSGTTMRVVRRCGYLGNKRYIQVSKLSSTATAGTVVAASIHLSEPEVQPVSPTQ
jgi:hypothetical protein